jgi:hypothetical protein
MKSIYPTSKQQGRCITHHPTNRQIGSEKRARSSEGAPCLTCFLRAAFPVGALPSCPPLPPPQWSGPAPPAASGCRPAPEGPPLQTAPPQKHEYAGDRMPQHHRSSIQDPRGFLTATVVAVLKQPMAWSLTTEQLEVQSTTVMTTHPRPSAGPVLRLSFRTPQSLAAESLPIVAPLFSSLQQLPLSVLTCTRCSRPCSSRGPPSSSAAKSRSRGGWPAGVMPPSRGAGCTSPLSQSCRA